MTDGAPDTYPAIGDYGVIGDGRSAALVGRDGSVDWCCLPDFDSPAVFCRLLDRGRGGFWRLAPAQWEHVERRYHSNTNVLVTTFSGREGVAQVTDFMPVADRPGSAVPRIHRLIEGQEGAVEWQVRCKPTPDFAAEPPALQVVGSSQIAVAGKDGRFTITASFPLEVAPGGVIAARLQLRPGERHLMSFASGAAGVSAPEDERSALDRTLGYWRGWTQSLRYSGPYQAQVVRSALTLKLLIHESTGAMVAAPTTSLPEQPGGDINWDYRFVWLRDAAMVLDVLQRLGRHAESQRFFDWLERLDPDEPLQPVYTLRADTRLTERVLSHLHGYAHSRPVRVGNAAADQRQLDTAGHLLDAAHLCFKLMPRPIKPAFWAFLRQLADRVAGSWREPDHSIWETRLGRQQFLHSKLFAWIALDRALQMAAQMELPADRRRWERERHAIAEHILRAGFNPRIGAFSAVVGEDTVDAASLMIPLVGFLPADDPRMLSTVARVRAELERDGLVYRNSALATGEQEAAFVISSFWLTQNLAMQGETEEARRVFEGTMSRANDLGLLAEEIAPGTGRQWGNFPQALSHLGLIRAALTLAGPAPGASPAGRAADGRAFAATLNPDAQPS